MECGLCANERRATKPVMSSADNFLTRVRRSGNAAAIMEWAFGTKIRNEEKSRFFLHETGSRCATGLGSLGGWVLLKDQSVGGGMTTTRTEPKSASRLIRNSKWERNHTGLSAMAAAVGLETGSSNARGCRNLSPPAALWRSSSSSDYGRNCRAHPRRSLLDHSGRNR